MSSSSPAANIGITLPASAKIYHGPVESHRSIMARRSLPQNGSPSTKIQGEPNTPRATAASPCWRAMAFTSGSLIPASTESRSIPGSDDHLCDRIGIVGIEVIPEIARDDVFGQAGGGRRIGAIDVIESADC